MEENRKFTFKDALATAGNFFVAIFRGDLVLKLHADKYFPHILYTFALIWLCIWVSMRIDKTLLKVENNRKELSSLEIYRDQKRSELEELYSIRVTEKNLEKLGSELRRPEKPVTIIKRK
ncbi:MAG: hypothetical protein IK045_08070 [Bacteroidales bacterium]|nr:hypothetical protein [Bacteroidales bacterium]